MSQKKINAIVFTNDRAAQLSLFLDSVLKNAPGVFDLNVIVSYSSEEFQKGYEKVIEDYRYGDVNFVNREGDFKAQVLDLLKSGSEYSCFFLDDDIIYRPISYDDIDSQISSDDDVVCFSLRLGDNTTKCYTLGAENVLHDIRYDGEFMKWDWSLHYLDFGYPFAMDGHIFREKDIYKLVRKSQFTGVEEMEMALFDFAETFPRNMMTSYKHSALVGIPIGRVQESIDNEMTMALKDSLAIKMRTEMNVSFLAGDFINLESIDTSSINGCHQELSLGVTIKLKEKENE